MALSFGAVVASNNVLALKDFNTFLSNYLIHERPTWLHRRLIGGTRLWLYREAWKTFQELRVEMVKEDISLSLKDVEARLFAILYMAKQPQDVSNGRELFEILANITLEFQKIKSPRASESYA